MAERRGAGDQPWLRELDEALAAGNGINSRWPQLSTSLEQCRCAQVAQPNPDHRRTWGGLELDAKGEVFILGHNDGRRSVRVIPNPKIRRRSEIHVGHVDCVVPLPGQPVRKGWRELSIDDEPH
jgi:hypothetical protein